MMRGLWLRWGGLPQVLQPAFLLNRSIYTQDDRMWSCSDGARARWR